MRSNNSLPSSDEVSWGDAVIPAIGQRTDVDWADDALEFSRRNTLVVNPHSMQTSIPHVFAAGDAVSGPATVIEAVAAGHKATEAIHRLLNDEDLDRWAEELVAASKCKACEGGGSQPSLPPAVVLKVMSYLQ